MTSRSELKKLALIRRREAEALCSAKFYDGAIYLAGYVLEFALKARICRLLDMKAYPDTGDLRRVYATHDLRQLLTLAGLSQKLVVQENSLSDSWLTAASWRPEQRYDVPGRTTFEDVRKRLADVDKVLAWIRKYW